MKTSIPNPQPGQPPATLSGEVIVEDNTPVLPDPPPTLGYSGQDDAFATESNPEGLRYAEKRRKPGHVAPESPADDPEHHEPRISLGPDGE